MLKDKSISFDEMMDGITEAIGPAPQIGEVVHVTKPAFEFVVGKPNGGLNHEFVMKIEGPRPVECWDNGKLSTFYLDFTIKATVFHVTHRVGSNISDNHYIATFSYDCFGNGGQMTKLVAMDYRKELDIIKSKIAKVFEGKTVIYEGEN